MQQTVTPDPRGFSGFQWVARGSLSRLESLLETIIRGYPLRLIGGNACRERQLLRRAAAQAGTYIDLCSRPNAAGQSGAIQIHDNAVVKLPTTEILLR